MRWFYPNHCALTVKRAGDKGYKELKISTLIAMYTILMRMEQTAKAHIAAPYRVARLSLCFRAHGRLSIAWQEVCLHEKRW